jgi:prepilin-type N-terminal cleavage/methylation domain-containing protein
MLVRKVLPLMICPMASSTHPLSFRRAGFTLIELLVVIAIIAVLAGLLFPAASGALNSAKKTTAKNQAIQIATAITAYESEYGRLPSATGSNFDSAMVTMLCTTNDLSNNPRGIVFLEATSWKTGKGGTNSQGYADPFNANSIYSIALDTNYANSLTVPSQSQGGNIGSTNISKHIGVWTIFTNSGKQTLIDSWE